MRKLNILTTFIVLLALVFTSACTKLDEPLYDQIPGEMYPENADQVANLSVNTYKKLQNMVDDNGWWYLAQEISSDEICAPTRGADWYDGGKWAEVHMHTWGNDTESVNRMWSLFWDGITTSNQTLDMLRLLESNDAIKAKIGEVEVMRSFYYYLLIDNYGDAPYLITANVPANFQPEKVDRAIIFDSLTNTIERNLDYLKTGDSKYLATQNMAHALLAKLYINAEVYTGIPMWTEASEYCDKVMEGPYSLANDVKSPFVTANENSSEIIFAIPYDENDFQGFRIHMRTLHYQHNLTYDMSVGPWNGFAVVPTHFDTYEDIDIRKEAHFIWGPQYASDGTEIIESITGEPLNIDPYLPALSMTDGYTPEQIRTTGARFRKFEIKMGAKENLSNDFPLFRLSDFYLMKAECEIRLGNSGDEWVNPIRERAQVSPYSGCTLDELLAERGREVFLEGHRRQDLIRFNKWQGSWWEKEAHGAEQDVFPIPQWAIDVNPNLGK